MTAYSNTAALADAYAAAKAAAEAAEAKVKALREEILSLGYDVIHGETASVKVTPSERSTFDSKLAKTFLTDDQIKACSGKTDIYTVTVKPRLAAAA